MMKKAISWSTKAAEHGNVVAQYNLGVCYYYGEGVNQDYSKAYALFTKAAEQGYAEAQDALSRLGHINKIIIL